jgi:hypothetical protein
MARWLGAFSVVLAAGSLSGGYALAGRWPWLLVLGGLGLLWLAGFRRGWIWAASLSLIGFALAAAAGLLQGLGAGWMALGLVAALCAWDLNYLAQSLRDLEPVTTHRQLERNHIRRLLAVAGLGLALAAIALTVEIRLPFFLALLLGGLAAWSLGRVAGYLRRESD